jgi:secreted protein with Ig-like and vWFA domain
MVVIRNVFRLKFGKAREAVALFKEGIAIQKRVGAGAGIDFPTRLLTDVTGSFYTVVLELTVPNLAAFERAAPQLLGDKDWQANDQKIGSLVESGSREIFTLVE